LTLLCSGKNSVKYSWILIVMWIATEIDLLLVRRRTTQKVL